MTNVHGPGTYPTLLGDLLVREGSDFRPPNPEGPPSLEWSWFDGEQLSWPLAIRTRKAGDRMLPRGGAGRRKLSDLLIDAKIPRPERDQLPVVTTAAGELLFVPGLRPSQTAAPSDRTTRRIGLAVLPKPDHDALVDRSIAKGNTRTRTYHRRGSVESGRKSRGAAGTSNDERTSGCSGERGDLLVAIDERNSRAPGT
jgi:tRNA(Ile)-lysidine synthetase-like protein